MGQQAAGFYAPPENNPRKKPGDKLPGGSDLTGQAILGQVEPNSGGQLPNPPPESGFVTGYRSSKTPKPRERAQAPKPSRRYSKKQREKATAPVQRPEPRKRLTGKQSRALTEVPV